MPPAAIATRTYLHAFSLSCIYVSIPQSVPSLPSLYCCVLMFSRQDKKNTPLRCSAHSRRVPFLMSLREFENPPPPLLCQESDYCCCIATHIYTLLLSCFASSERTVIDVCYFYFAAVDDKHTHTHTHTHTPLQLFALRGASPLVSLRGFTSRTPPQPPLLPSSGNQEQAPLSTNNVLICTCLSSFSLSLQTFPCFCFLISAST